MDFTLKKYCELLTALRNCGFQFFPFCEFLPAGGRPVCLRHDVDSRPENSLTMAGLEAGMGIRASYYFRAVPESWDEDIIRAVSALGHEVGYHYESIATAGGNINRAYDDFCRNLEKLRKLAPVSTICMHGSPRSPYDSREMWGLFDYKSLGLIAEPYMDTDWESTFYLTDTGRRWDGYNVSVRDKIPRWQDVWTERRLVFHSTDDIINGSRRLPPKIMITTHPQRWDDNLFFWFMELVSQNIKNIIKSRLINRR